MLRSSSIVFVASLSSLSIAGCAAEGTPSEAGSAASVAASTGQGGAGGTSAATTGGTGAGGSGTGGTGGAGGAMVCTPGTEEPCYTGPAGTEGIGVCAAGTAVCNADGTALGPCMGDVLPGIETCATPEDDDCDGNAASCTGNHIWSKRFGELDTQTVTSVAVDKSGNVVMTGSLYGTADFGGGLLTSAGVNDVYVAKFDASGNHLWSKSFGDATNQTVHAVAFDGAGNVLVTGEFLGTVDFGGGPLMSGADYDIFVFKLDASGNHVWSKGFVGPGPSYEAGIGVGTDSAGNVLLTGAFFGALDFGGALLSAVGNADVFVVKFDPSGNHVWSKRFGGMSAERPLALATDSTGNTTIVGYFNGTVSFGGPALVSAGGDDIFVAKLDPSGGHLWSKGFGDANPQRPYAVATDVSGNTIVTGTFEGSGVDFGGGPLANAGGQDIFIAKFDGSGNHLWSKGFGNATNEASNGVAADSTGNVVFTGSFDGMVDFGGGPITSGGSGDAFIAKLDASGNHVWSKGFGDGSTQIGNCVATDSTSNVIAAGVFQGSIDFGGGPLTSANGYDIYLAKLAP